MDKGNKLKDLSKNISDSADQLLTTNQGLNVNEMKEQPFFKMALFLLNMCYDHQ
jgi:hypothetical protein